MRTVVNVMKLVTLALAATAALDGSAWAVLCGADPLPPCTEVPEIDPTMLRGAVAVLAGGALMLAGRRRRS